MPSQMPSSFASAAAGSRDPRSARGDGSSGDWGRNNRTNGTVTLRRSSTTPFAKSSSGSAPLPTPTEVPYSTNSERYGKNQLLDIFRAQENLEASNRDVASLFAANWNPNSNGTNGRGWGVHDSRDSNGPDICWDANGSVHPIGLDEMTESEKEIFKEDVNSPLKPPPSTRDSNGQVANGRRTSTSHVLSSPASRPGTRRQQTSDSITGLGSPAGTGRFSRDESSPFFTRRGTDLNDSLDDRAEDTKNNTPFGGLMRSNTAGSAIGNGPSSPWGAAPGSATMGSFGSFAIGQTNPLTPSEKRPNLARGESRFANLMPKDSSEDISSKTGQSSWRPRPRTDTDPFGDDGLNLTGSAALGGGQDSSPPLNSQRRAPGLDTPVRGASSDFGMSDLPAFRDSRGQSHQTPQGRHAEHEPLSPADTNPYGSPPDDQDDESYEGEPLQHNRLGNIPEHGSNTFGNLHRGYSNVAFDGSDRSQTSSVGLSRGLPAPVQSLSNLSGMGGWPTGGNPIGTPDRENRSAFPGVFGNSVFGATGDLQSPSFGAIGGMFGPGTTGVNTVGRGNSKLGSLFPAAMQAQMQGPDDNNPVDPGDMRSSNTFGSIGRNTFSRETDSPMRSGRNAFEDLFPPTEESQSRNQGPFSSSDNPQGQTVTSFSQAPAVQSSYQQSQASSDSFSTNLPAAQQRQMVMPDRMNWVYLDSQGNVQGPWTGLQMHEWYKASFFTADLSVRKVEDTEFEPLGQLIRRIGNSREPFLVPQIGIPHGPPTTEAGAPFTPAAAGPGNSMAPVGAVQPPFAGAFPSFGTTLTAEQQNNLERRKQEEQFLMAQQREQLAQRQATMRQIQMNPASLHHHSSAHSLQSQPSYGSITSPIGMPPQPPIPGASGFFDGPPRQAPIHGASGIPPDFFREEDLSRLNIQDRQQSFGLGTAGPQPTHPQQTNLASQHPELQREAARMEQYRQNDPQGLARLREFEQLRAQHDLEEGEHSMQSDPIGPPQRHQQYQEPLDIQREEKLEPEALEAPSLTQQIQKAASAKQSPVPALQSDSPWAKVDSSMPMPFPPPAQSTTPLPAPTAQRGRSNLPDALNEDVRSRSETPEVAAVTPSVAPWAKESIEASKGPSLKQIQEAEAKKAAEAEREAATLRRVALEQELKMRSNQPMPPAAGLPTTSTWGSGASPSTPSSVPSPWATASAVKSQAATVAASQKKTLADIQREEELRKQRAAAATAAVQSSQGLSGGKRYADLASKASASGPALGGPWATVGAGGKVKPVGKIPTGPAASAPQTVRAASSASIPGTNARVARPVTATRSTTISAPTGVAAAKEEFNKWARGASKGLNSNVNVDEFITFMSECSEDLIAESVYANSATMDGRQFAAEYMRRKKLAEKGVIEPANLGASPSTTGGWNEVAKKGPPKEDSTAGFTVVPKKKGKK